MHDFIIYNRQATSRCDLIVDLLALPAESSQIPDALHLDYPKTSDELPQVFVQFLPAAHAIQ